MKHEAILPFEEDALEPLMSKETLSYHYGKHHKAYANNLNKLIVDTEFAEMSLIDIIKKSTGGIHKNSAQLWNHSFFWNCLTPLNEFEVDGPFLKAMNDEFGSIDAFKEEFTKSAMGNFGSGWTWLVKDNSGKLSIVNTSNEGCVLTDDLTPLLVVDVWEHAYYIDYRNARNEFLKYFWELVNWNFVTAFFLHFFVCFLLFCGTVTEYAFK